MTQKNIHSVGSQAIALALGAALSQVLVALLYINAARASSPSEYGIVVSAIALGNALVGFIDFGSNSLWVRELASQELSIDEVGTRAVIKLLIVGLIGVVATAASCLWLPQFVFAPAVLAAVAYVQTMVVPLRSERRGIAVSVILLTERAAAAAIYVVAILAGANPLVALIPALVSGSILAGIIATLVTPRAHRFRFTKKLWVNPWSGAKHYGFYSVALSAQQLDLPLLVLVAGNAAAGNYGAVNRWTQPLALLASAFSGAAAPFLAKASSIKQAAKVVSSSIWILLVAIGAAVVVIFTAPLLVLWLLGPDYASSSPLLQLLALGTIPAILNQPLATALQARRHDRLVSNLVVSAVLIQLLLVSILGTLLGSIGAGIAYCLLQTLLLIGLTFSIGFLSHRENPKEITLDSDELLIRNRTEKLEQ